MSAPELQGAEVDNQSVAQPESKFDKVFQEAQDGMKTFMQSAKDTFSSAGKELNDEVNKVLGNLDIFDDSKLPGMVEAAARVVPSETPEKAPEPFPHQEYKGEKGITKDVAPGEATVKNGDTLEKIARQHLGPNATAAEVAAHAKEIAKINDIENPKMIHEGDKLKLPGHTKDGGFITQDGQGNTLTQYEDGRLRVQSKDGSKGFDRAPDGQGGYYEQGWGKQNEENYRLHHHKDGEVNLCTSDWKDRGVVWEEDRQKLKYVRERDNGKR